MTASILLIVPAGRDRRVKIKLTAEVARWLSDQLVEALGAPRPKPRRPVKIRRGRWTHRRAPR